MAACAGIRRNRVEIRIHGRGGQGTVTLAALLADAAFRSGWHVLAFPTFGTERTGAPVSAFVRLDREPIRDRGEVRDPAFVLVQDDTLVGAVDVLAGLDPRGLVLLNAATIPDALVSAPVVAIPATTMARAFLANTKTSTAMLGAFAAASGVVTLEAVCDAIRSRFSGELGEANVALAKAACELLVAGGVAA